MHLGASLGACMKVCCKVPREDTSQCAVKPAGIVPYTANWSVLQCLLQSLQSSTYTHFNECSMTYLIKHTSLNTYHGNV